MKLARRQPKNKEDFWVTNISKRIVSLSDLALCIQPLTTVNLLDSRHYNLTKEQLLQSSTVGSIHKKSNKIIVRKVPPGKLSKTRVLINENATFPTKHHSAVELENIKYEELDVSDDDYASENIDSAQIDNLGKWKK